MKPYFLLIVILFIDLYVTLLIYSVIQTYFFSHHFKCSSLPENFLGAETLEVCTNGVETLKCGLNTQGSKHILWAHFIEVEGYTGYVFSITWLDVVLGFQHKGTLNGKENALYCIQQLGYYF